MTALAAQPPTTFGKYQLLDRLATGGMAEIYRAKLTGAAGVTKSVVIKKILPHHAHNRSFINMFINEARIVAGLSHGNIAHVFDFGEIAGEYFIAMEYVHGQPLSSVLRRAKHLSIPVLPTPFAVLVALEVCKGLHYAHTRVDEQGQPLKIVHRDVSPQNVLIDYEGQVKLVDFGIAKARNATRVQTGAGAVKGKYAYFAPEQVRGEELDARTDVFAAGVVLFESLCGRLPFEGKMVPALRLIAKGEFPRPRALNPDITPALERIVLTAMALEPATRYPNAEAFQEALATHLYTHAPTFAASSLSNLMQHLFEPELSAEGLAVKLPKDFLEQVALWRKVLPEPPSKGPLESASAVAHRKLRAKLPGPEDDTATESVLVQNESRTKLPAVRRRLPLWLWVGVPLLGVIAAALAVIAWRS